MKIQSFLNHNAAVSILQKTTPGQLLCAVAPEIVWLNFND